MRLECVRLRTTVGGGCWLAGQQTLVSERPGGATLACPFACSFVLRVGIIRVESCWTRGPCVSSVSSVPSVSSVSGARVSHFVRVKRVHACWLPCVSCVSSVPYALHLMRVKRVKRAEGHACCVLCVLGTSLLANTAANRAVSARRREASRSPDEGGRHQTKPDATSRNEPIGVLAI